MEDASPYPGQYTFAAVGSDYLGNVGFSNDIVFTVDGATPVLTIQTPQPNFSYRTLPTARGTVTGASAVTQVRATLYRYKDRTWWNGSAWVSSTVELNATGTTSWTINLPALVDGKYGFTAIARDAQGAERASSSADFLIDTKAPSINVLTPVAGLTYLSLSQATGTASDATGGVAEVRVRLFRSSDSRW